MLSVADVMEKSKEIINKPYYLPKSSRNGKGINKGLGGLKFEKLVGIKQSSNCLDLCDGEVKCFPIKIVKIGREKGNIAPKETISITNINYKNLTTEKFEESRCCKKIHRIIFVPYIWNCKYITFMKPILIDMSENKNLSEQIQIDYNAIQNNFLENGKLESKTGKYIQSRTKGQKNDKNKRAFYYRTNFIKEFVCVHSLLPSWYSHSYFDKKHIEYVSDIDIQLSLENQEETEEERSKRLIILYDNLSGL